MRWETRRTAKSDAEVGPIMDRHFTTKNQRGGVETNLLPANPKSLPHLADPYDAKADLNERARAYLHSNCAQCHVEAGGGNAQMELEFTTPPDKMRLIGVRPVHDTFGIPDAKLVYPGHPEKSVLLHRIANRDRGHMPPLATSMVDRATVGLMRDWILELGRGKAAIPSPRP